jgi:hypothetical protein
LPAQWKESNIATIPKEGDRTDCSSYRRISLPSISYKSLYNILLSRLSPYMDEVGDISIGFDVTDELLIKFFSFFKCWKRKTEMGVQRDSTSAIHRFQENLLFS